MYSSWKERLDVKTSETWSVKQKAGFVNKLQYENRGFIEIYIMC